MKAPKWNQNPPSFWKREHLRLLQPSNQPFQCPPNSQWRGSKKVQGVFPILPLNQLGETSLQVRGEPLPILTDIRVTLLLLNHTTIKQPLSWSTKIVQTVGLSNELQEVPISHPIPFFLGPLRDTHPFLLSLSASAHLLGWDFKYDAKIRSSPKGEIILEFDSSHQSNPSLH